MTDSAGSSLSTADHSSEAAIYGSGIPVPASLAPDLLDRASDALIVRSLSDDRILFWSGGAERLYGWSSTEALGQRCRELLRSQSVTSHSLDEMFNAESFWRGELIHTRRDGATITVESCQTLRRGEAGTADVLVIDRDVSDRIQAEQALRDSEARFRSLADASNVGFLTISTERRANYANRAMAALLGISQQDVNGSDLLDLCFPEDRAFLADQLEAVRRDGAIEQFDLRFRRADGAEAWALASLSAISAISAVNGTQQDVALFCADVTARKRAIADLAELNSRLARAIAEGHHRIKNNLQALAGMIDLQMMNHSEMVPSRELQRLSQYTRSLASLHDIMTLDLRAQGVAESIAFQTAVEKIIAVLQPLAPGRSIVSRVEDARLTLKQGSAVALLLNELITNAIEHGEGAISVMSIARGRDLHIEVQDEGPGFPAGFDPSFSANTGLMLVETAARWDLRGQVTYGVRPDGGGRVTVQFPIEG